MTTGESHYVIDADDRIVAVRGSLRSTLDSFLGHSLWESSPHAEPLFRPHFDEARRTGRSVEFATFYAGRLARRRVVPVDQTLTVYVTPLENLNIKTLGTLTASFQRMISVLAAQESSRRDPRAPASLQALP